jgi:hypothetical protein
MSDLRFPISDLIVIKGIQKWMPLIIVVEIKLLFQILYLKWMVYFRFIDNRPW